MDLTLFYVLFIVAYISYYFLVILYDTPLYTSIIKQIFATMIYIILSVMSCDLFIRLLNSFYIDSQYYNHVIINSKTAKNTFTNHIKYISEHIFDIEYSKFDIIDIDGIKYIYPSSKYNFRNLIITPYKDDDNKITQIQIKCFYKNELFTHFNDIQ